MDVNKTVIHVPFHIKNNAVFFENNIIIIYLYKYLKIIIIILKIIS